MENTYFSRKSTNSSGLRDSVPKHSCHRAEHSWPLNTGHSCTAESPRRWGGKWRRYARDKNNRPIEFGAIIFNKLFLRETNVCYYIMIVCIYFVSDMNCFWRSSFCFHNFLKYISLTIRLISLLPKKKKMRIHFFEGDFCSFITGKLYFPWFWSSCFKNIRT